MNTITDMEYRLFKQKKFLAFTAFVLLFFAAINPSFARTHTERIAKKNPGVSHSGHWVIPNRLNLMAPPTAYFVAYPDSGQVNGYNGNASLLNIYANDSFNNLALIGSATKLTITLPNAHFTIDTLTGILGVSAGTPAGNYTINYTIEDPLDASNYASSFAFVEVTAPIISTNSESATASGFTGNANLFNIYTNDLINGNTVTAGAVNTSIVTGASHPGISLNTSTGVVSVAAFTPAALYTINYKNCDTLNTTNCDTATASINVTAPLIVTNADAASINGYNANASLLNIFDNDSLNGALVSAAAVKSTLTIAPNNTHITIDTITGNVAVSAGLAAGIYTFTYQICDTFNTANCSSTTVTITATAPNIIANSESGNANGILGNPNLYNIYTNDLINGNTVTAGAVTTSIVTGASHPGISLNTSTGVVSVADYTPAALYTIDYKNCDTLNTTNCDTATASITVTAPLIVANADAASINGYSASTSLLNILNNDSLNGATVVASALKTTLLVAPSSSHIIVDTTTGNVSTTAGLAAGVYTITYQICDTFNIANCASAVASITATAPAIVTSGETGTCASIEGNNNLLNVLSNDSINGDAVSLGSVITSVVTAASHAGVALNISTGVVSVAPLTPAGNYTIVYKNCDTLNPGNCDTAVISVTVTPPSIIANGESASINGYPSHANLLNVLNNDSFNNQLATVGPVVLSLVSSSNPKISLNLSSGNISVASGLHAGNYSLIYRICDSLNSSNCDTAIVSIAVSAPAIVANADYVAVNGYNGSLNVLNIYVNDSINSIVAASGRVALTVLSSPSEPGVIINASTGKISVFPYTPAGVYFFEYRICDTLNTSNCDTALVTVNVLAPAIIANNDNGAASGYNGNSNLLNVFANDSLNNKATNITQVNLSIINPAAHPGVALNLTNGIVSVAVGTPAGLYTIDYKICDTLNPGNCDSASITVNVSQPVIVAHADNGSANSYNGNSNLLNIFVNDSLNGSIITAGRVNLSILDTASNAGINLNLTTGNVSVAAYTPAGFYTIRYKICDTLNAGNCDSALINVTITAPILMANADHGSVNGANGNANLLNIFGNDSINGGSVNANGILCTLINPASNAGISLDTATGIVSVAPSTIAGNYNLIYRICDTLNTGNCDTAMVYITVSAPIINANNDSIAINGFTGANNVLYVLANDSLNNDTIALGAAYLSVSQNASHPNITLNTSTGYISVAPFTPAGDYTIQYKICDTLNVSNCDSGIVAIHITAPPILAVNDTAYVNSYDGNSSALNIISNDSLNNDTIATGAVLIRLINAASNAGISLDTATGIVAVAPLTPAGNYSLDYSITDTLNPNNIDTATAYVYITAPSIIATTDLASVNSYDGDTSVLNVLDNDSINGQVASIGGVILNLITPASNLGVSLNDTTGIIKVAPLTPVGLYTITYRICDTLNTTNCDTTTDSITVVGPLVIATNDSVNANGYNTYSNLINVLDNDSINGAAVIAGGIKLTTLSPASVAGIVLNDTTGIVKLDPRIAAGIYTIEYEICDTLNPGNCDTAYLTIQVTAPPIIAVNDTALVNGYNGTSGIYNVLPNDSINGIVANLSNVKFKVYMGSGRPDITLDSTTAFLTVLPNTPSGNYTISYIICDTLNANNCDTGILYIQITPPPIYANPDVFITNGYPGNLNIGNVLLNDSLNSAILTPAKVFMSVVTGTGNANILLNTSNGQISVFPGTPAGTYHMVYRVCDTINPTSCDTALVTIQVLAPSIIATNDSASVNGAIGNANLLNIFSNDSINGIVATSSNTKLHIITPFGNAAFSIDTISGKVSVASPIAAGIYTLSYSICDTLNPGNCDTANVVVTITAPIIIAIADSAKANGSIGAANIINVLSNDSINGQVATTSNIWFSVLQKSGNAGVILDSITAKVSVLAGTAPGIYTMQYRICDTLNPGNCDTAWVYIEVTPANLFTQADSGSVNGYKGMSNLINVLSNDSLNGAVITAPQVKITVLSPASNLNVSLDTLSGNISVAGRTPAGVYAITYLLTDTLDLSNQDSAIATINVYAVGPIANPDFASTAAKKLVTINPISNDYDIDTNINISSLHIYTGPLHGKATADTIAGTISYTPDSTWSGYDTLYYSICDSGMVPVLCDTSFIVIHTLDSISLISSTTIDNKCYGDSIGSILIAVKGGLAPYSITWNTIPVQTDSLAKNLKAGNYTAKVKDANNDSISFTFTVKQPTAAMNVVSTIVKPKCYGDFNGSIDLSTTGGTAPYRYFWNNGSILNKLDKLNAGNYAVSVTDTNGCKVTKNYVLAEPAPLSVSVTSIVDVICKSTKEGSINLSVSGGTKPYTYLWNEGSTTLNLSNIADGNYSILIKDSNACEVAGNYVVNYSKDKCDQDVFIPKGFSPDDDGLNDAFKIEGIEKFPDNYLRVYNRWGGLVFEEHGYKNTWKGTYDAGSTSGTEALPGGTYYYVLQLSADAKPITGYTFISK